MRAVGAEISTAKFDLILDFTAANGLLGTLSTPPIFFDAATIDGLGAHFRNPASRGSSRGPALPSESMPMLAEAERQALVVTWNQTTTAYPRDAGVAALFEAAAERPPGGDRGPLRRRDGLWRLDRRAEPARAPPAEQGSRRGDAVASTRPAASR